MVQKIDWGKFIEECEHSGKTVAGFCRQRGVRENQYWYWKKRLSGTGRKLVRVGEPRKIEIMLANGVTLRLPVDCGVEAIRVILEALHAVGT